LKGRAYIDTYRCNGCGTCTEIDPEDFRINENMEKAELVDHEDGFRGQVEMAVSMCPKQCIEITE